MNEYQIKLGIEIKNLIDQVERELEVWEKAVEHKKIFAAFHHIPESMFHDFREQIIKHLEDKLKSLDAQFKAL